MKTYFRQLLAGSLSVFLIVFLFSCKNRSKNDNDQDKKVVVRVHDTYLYENDLENIFVSGMSKEDSIDKRETFINNWIKDQLVFHKALVNLTDEEKDKSDELEKYYQSLITYEYQTKVINQRLQEKVTEEEIQEYYNKNPGYFVLNRCIIRLIFLQLQNNAKDLKKVREWYKSDEVEKRDQLHQYCLVNALQYNLDDTKWFYLDDLQMDIPGFNSCIDLEQNKSFELSDSNYLYLISIKDVLKEGDQSPIEFEREKIKNIILHKKSTDLIKSIEDQIVEEGIKKNYIEYGKN